MSRLSLRFEYDAPPQRVFDWWTDLSGVGYVGRKLRSITVIGKEEEKTLVRTEWEMMRMTKTITERFSIRSPTHWIWEPRLFGIALVDDFELTVSSDGKTTLTITSEAKTINTNGRIAQLMLGWYLDRMMIEEWKSADQAFRSALLRRCSSADGDGLVAIRGRVDAPSHHSSHDGRNLQCGRCEGLEAESQEHRQGAGVRRSRTPHRIRIFTGGCSLCQDVVDMVEVGKCKDCEMDVLRADAKENEELVRRYDIRAVPSMVIDGRIKVVGVPTFPWFCGEKFYQMLEAKYPLKSR